MNTIQMVRPIPKFNTFANGNQTEVSSNNNYIQPNHGYMSQGMSLPKIIPSGSEEELHRAADVWIEDVIHILPKATEKCKVAK